ncbi:GNAT family acetyltransferase [Herbiconiux moechotypicola]|uniref:GNAT family N-acetyltransferase n=1 Tax=Herbiconiux moechotypicola TaxID=637393 RepID=A0ABP5QL84_9MICO|nr:GNAT family acetyltransferase [Herbiconiux moechotypicola]MCS5731454.1 GNAT family acetyltransferase [Herbiconiux moechotypicola]
MARTRDIEAQRRRLSEATWAVLTERGPVGLTVRAVAERAGCTTGLVMHTFPTKEALLLHARETLHERTRVSAEAAEAAAEGAGPEGALLAVLLNTLSVDEESREIARVWVSYLAAALGDEALTERHTSANLRFVERVTRLLAACRPGWSAERVRVEVLGLIALTDGLNALGTADAETYSPEVQRRAVTEAVRRALGDGVGSTEAAGAHGADSDDEADSEGGLRIRAFREEDTEAVVALWEAAGLTRAWNDPRRDIVRKLEVQRELFLVGELPGETDGGDGGGGVGVGGRIVASVMAGYEGHRGWVNYLAVAPGERGRGHARRLMDEVEELLTARGCPKLNLQVREGNDAAIGFYRALGYTQDASLSFGKRLIPDDPVADGASAARAV